jgi:hypothetical protein
MKIISVDNKANGLFSYKKTRLKINVHILTSVQNGTCPLQHLTISLEN